MTEVSDRFLYVKRDAFSGIIVGLMAIPLNAGICIMSDYPILTGLVTVIFACIVGFVSSLFRPGNYIGVPGIAAGLAPAFAGAYTKLSNLFTAAVVLIIVLFPALLNYLPQFSLGIIMLFSGWKMISGLQNVINMHGKYEVGLSIFCGLCVYKFGIFEGLLMALAIHLIAVKVFKVKNFQLEELMKD